MCNKSKQYKHEELYGFSQYGNNALKKADFRLGNWYCKEHFQKKSEELDKKSSK